MKTYQNKTSEAWQAVVDSKQQKIDRLMSALKLIAVSDNFRDGTSVKELQQISRNIVAQETILPTHSSP